ncbi:hypothetical protein GpartN1_g6147.t1 [Galdieria partita]|uniref:non-specific serine/threonine protein kinase n=1 Tax=Galdieria partita TaxID=83374 RepID=A0A9C7Q2M9_9RHOD|nr:hypothetical protein GpartN1_g6147.t1 [Galdieria partita]
MECTWSRARNEELEALKAIFGEDLKEINVNNLKKNNKKQRKKEKVLEISLFPFTGQAETKQVVVCLQFRLGPKYPVGEAPKLSLKEVQGRLPLSQRKLRELQKEISQVPLTYKGRVCVYDIVEFVRERIIEYCLSHDKTANIEGTISASEGLPKSEITTEPEVQVNTKALLEKQEEERVAEEEYAAERNARKKLPDTGLDLESFLRSNSSAKEGLRRRSSGKHLDVSDYIDDVTFSEPLSSGSERMDELSSLILDHVSEEALVSSYGQEEEEEEEQAEFDLNISKEEIFVRHLLRSLFYFNGRNLGDEEMDLSHVEILEEVFGDIRLDHLNNPSEVEAFRRLFWNQMRRASKKRGIENIFWSILMNSSVIRRQLASRFRPLLSRYREDFEYLRLLGRGGFGSVMKVRNKLDGRIYALKRVALTEELLQERHILREVTTLSRLSHPHVVRYHHAWLENNESLENSPEQTETPDGAKVVAYLYIQMEYCRRTLREFIDHVIDKNEDLWGLFRQIVEGLHHIHHCGILHRDLKPTNIFFDAQGTIKIGDFGLAKEIVTQEGTLSVSDNRRVDTVSSSGKLNWSNSFGNDRTGGVGTLYYRAPELEENEFPTYDSKVDIYSLGIIAFELWHGPFETAMERHEVLMRLRETGSPDDDFQRRLQRQGKLIRSLLMKDPKKRPDAGQILDGDFLPPKVEDEYVREVMRRIGDPVSHLYMKALSTIFDSAPCWNRNSLSDESLMVFPNKLFENFSSSFYLCYSQILDNLENTLRSVFQKYGAVPFQHNVSSFALHELQNRSSEDNDSFQLLLRSGKKISFCGSFRRHMLGEYLSLGKNLRLFEFGEAWDLEEDGFWDNWHHYESEMYSSNVKDIRSYRVVELNSFYSTGHVVLDAELLFLVSELCQHFRSHYGKPISIRLSHAELLPAILAHTGFFQVFRPRQEVSKQLIQNVSSILSSSFYKGNNLVGRELMIALSSENIMSNSDSHQKRLIQRTIEKLCCFAGLRGSPRTVIAQLMRLLEASPGQPFLPASKLSAFIETESMRRSSLSSNRSPSYRHSNMEKKQVVNAMIYAPAAKALERIVDVLLTLDKIAGFQFELLTLDPVLYKRADCFHGIIFEAVTRGTSNRPSYTFVGYGGSWRESIPEESVYYLHSNVSKDSWEALGMTFCLEKLAKQMCRESMRACNIFGCDVFVMSIGGDGLLDLRFAIVSELRAGNIRTEFLPVANPSLHEQMSAAKSCGAHWMVLLRDHVIDSRLDAGDIVLKVKSLNGKTETEVTRKQLIYYLSNVIANSKE